MIDLHCHILPGIDDGPGDMEESIAMAETALRDGITTIVATPHVKNTLLPEGLIQEKVAAFSRRLKELAIPLKVLRGADVQASLDPLLLTDYTIEGTRCLLVEFPHTHLPMNAGKVLFAMKAKGFCPIITHPERNPSIIRDPGLLLKLAEDQTLVQITGGSLTGDFGPEVQECASYLLRKGAVMFIASDSHSNGSRRPVLSGAVRVAERLVGREKALRLVTANPERVLKGESLYH